jgi:hypothetical protein
MFLKNLKRHERDEDSDETSMIDQKSFAQRSIGIEVLFGDNLGVV